MELDKGCNNLKNVSQVCGNISNVEQIESKVDNMVKVVVTKLYKGKNTDSIETVVDNDSYEIYANLTQIQYSSVSQFPKMGSDRLIYVNKADNSLWRYDTDTSQYSKVGNFDIVNLVGTQENPIHLGEDIELGKIYFISGWYKTYSSGPDELPTEGKKYLCYATDIDNLGRKTIIIYGYKFPSGSYLATDTALPTSGSYVVTSSRYADNIGYFNSLSMINGRGDIGNLLFTGIYAPITSGTTGQILQSNGNGNAPTWVNNKSGLNLEHSEFVPEDYGDIWSALDDSFVEMRTNYGNNLANVSCQDGYAVLTAYNSVIDKTVEFIVFADENQQNAGISINIHNNQTSTDTNVTLTEEGFKYNGNQILTSETGMEKTNIENLSIDTINWSALSDSSPYTYSATVTAITNISDNSVVELINNQAVLFATYGFAIGSISGQNITIYSIGQPSTSVTLTVGVTG